MTTWREDVEARVQWGKTPLPCLRDGCTPAAWCSYCLTIQGLDSEIARLTAELERWLAWSDGQYPDASPGDVIHAQADGTITLDDAITTWEPLRALKWYAAELERVTQERDYFQSRLSDFSAAAQADFARAEQAEAEVERLRVQANLDAERAAILSSAVGRARLILGDASKETTVLIDHALAAAEQEAGDG